MRFAWWVCVCVCVVVCAFRQLYFLSDFACYAYAYEDEMCAKNVEHMQYCQNENVERGSESAKVTFT